MLKREPARILAVVGAALALAIGFGLKLSGEQVNLIMVFAAAVIPLLVGETTRTQVVPVEVANTQIRTAVRMAPDTELADVIKAAKEHL